MSSLISKKAFDRVWHAALWATMRKYNISANLVRTIEQLYDKATSAVQMDGSIGEWFRTTVGVRQTMVLRNTEVGRWVLPFCKRRSAPTSRMEGATKMNLTGLGSMQSIPVCPTCKNAYILKDTRQHRKPILLHCGHTFCETCMLHLVKENKTSLPCPACKEVTTVPTGESGTKFLNPDRYVIGMMVHNQNILLQQELSKITVPMMKAPKRQTAVSEHMCQECKKKLSSVKCVECATILCHSCFDKIHRRSSTLQQHTQVPVDDDGQLEVSQMCKIHDNRPIEYYCEDDDMIICSRCVIVGSHKGHNISSIEDKNRHIVAEMEPALQVANHVHRRLKKIDKDIVEQLPDFRQEYFPALEAVNNHFQHLHGLLQIREQELEKQIIEVYKGSLEPISRLRTEKQEEIKQLDTTIKAAQRVINNNDEIIVNAKEILQKLENAKDITCIIERNDDVATARKVVFCPGTSIDTEILQYGRVEGTAAESFSLFSLRDKPEKFTEDTESLRSTTPDDMRSVVSTTSTDAVIIEEEQIVILDDASSVKSDGSSRSNKNIRKKQEPQRNKTERDLPTKPKIKGHNDKVFVTHIQNPCRFMVQSKADGSKLTTLSYSLNNWCNSPSADKQTVSAVEIGDIVLARYTHDKNWYRARIKNVILTDDEEDIGAVKVEVIYIDYGNSEIISLDRCRRILPKYMKHPPFSMECALFNIVPYDKGGWSLDAVKTFAKMVENKPMLLTVIQEENNVLQVDLSKPPDEEILDDRPMSVRDALVFLELANFESEHSVPSITDLNIPSRNFLKPEPASEGQMYNIAVTYAGKPDCFYAQELGEESQYLAKMMEEMQNTYGSHMRDSWQILCPQIGMICVALFSGDSMWYRARIIGLPGNRQVDVHYVDFGNSERVSIFNCRKILDSFLVLPSQALCCSLTDVEPIDVEEGWSENCLRWWSEVVTMKNFTMKITDINSTWSVVLRELDADPTDSVNIRIVENELAASTGKWSETSKIEVSNADMTEEVRRLTYKEGSSFPQTSSDTSQPTYWRTRHKKVPSRRTEPVFTPPMSPVKDVEASKREKSPRQEVVAVKHKSPTKELVPVGDDSKAIGRTPSKSPKASKSDESKQGTTKKDKRIDVEVVVSYFVSPSEFNVQLASAGKDGLDELMSSMAEAYKDSEVTWVSWQKGGHCVALSEDGKWYRARITKIIHKNLIEVLMLDYGFKEFVSTSKLRTIVKQFRDPRCFSFCCHLADVTPAGGNKNWSRTASEFMEEQIKSNKLFIKRKGNTENNSLPVDLIIEEYIEETALEPGHKIYHSLINMIKEKGLAIPLKKKTGSEEPTESSKPLPSPVCPVLHYRKVDCKVATGDRVLPVYVDYNAVIHFYTMGGDEPFQKLCDGLFTKFKDSTPHSDQQEWVQGQGVVAFYVKDEAWCRANIITIEPARVYVHYIDFGNCEWVSYEHLRADIADFLGLPQQTFLSELHDLKPTSVDGKWPVTVIDYLHNEIVNKHCTIQVLDHPRDKPLAVNLNLNGKDVATALVQYGMAQRGNYITDQEQQSAQIQNVLKSQNSYKLTDLGEVSETVPVIVTHVELPNVVYLQHTRTVLNEDQPEEKQEKVNTINKQLDRLEQLSLDLNKVAPFLPVIPLPKIGLACCAQFGLDSCWYRALVIDVYAETQQLLILFVDYGNSEIITVNKMRALPPKYQSLPCQGMRCCLAGLCPPGDAISWTKKSLMSMMNVLANVPINAKVVKEAPLTVELYETSFTTEQPQLVYQSVIDDGVLQLKPGGYQSGKKTDQPVVEIKITESNVEADQSRRNNIESRDLGVKPAIVPSPLQSESESESVATVTSDPQQDSKAKSVQSKSWADMVENEDSDLNELPDLSEDETNYEMKEDSDDIQDLEKPPTVEECFD